MGVRWKTRARGLSAALTTIALLAVALALAGSSSIPARTPRASSHQSVRAAGTVRPMQVATPEAALPSGLLPTRLVIPKLGLDAPILAIGADGSGAMQVPRPPDPRDSVWGEVYWWSVGYAPGQVGDAVIAGHVNRPDAGPAAFTHLNWLVPGDQLRVITADGHTLTFVVTAKSTPLVPRQYRDNPTIERIFGPALTANLNLLTCWGEWDGKEFDRRLVISTTLAGVSPFPQGIGVHG